MKFNIKTVESKIDNVLAIQLLDAPFTGMIVSYGKVAFDELREDVDDLVPILNYDYTVHDDGGLTYDLSELETRLGDILLDLIEEGLRNNTLIYSGGVDENRKFDPIESDSE